MSGEKRLVCYEKASALRSIYGACGRFLEFAEDERAASRRGRAGPDQIISSGQRGLTSKA